MHMCMCARVGMCACVWRHEWMPGFAQLLSTSFTETESLSEVWTQQVCLPEYFSLPKVSAFWTLGLQAITMPAWLLYWSWDANSSPHACGTDAWPTDPPHKFQWDISVYASSLCAGLVRWPCFLSRIIVLWLERSSSTILTSHKVNIFSWAIIPI